MPDRYSSLPYFKDSVELRSCGDFDVEKSKHFERHGVLYTLGVEGMERSGRRRGKEEGGKNQCHFPKGCHWE